jgi:hypothetical protein
LVKSILILRLGLMLVLLALSAPCAFAQGGTPVFQHVYVPPPAPTPARAHIPESEPIPQGWIIAGEAALALISAVVLIAATRAWRSSNLFDRKYRFPSGEPAALRFGGTRSGGFMATIEPAKNKKDA